MKTLLSAAAEGFLAPFRATRDALRGDVLGRQYERVERAIRVKAQRVADAEFSHTMQNFYTEQVMDIDPHVSPKNAWAYASAKQKQYDHQQDYILYEGRMKEAEAKVEAETARYKALQEKYT